MALDTGDVAPDFELEGTEGRDYRLTDYTGEGGTGVILAFYPGDETAVCTRQMCAYRDASDRLDELGMPLLGISPQGVESHESFKANHSLTVPLLADTDQAVGKAYGVVGGPLRQYRRSVFVVDPGGIVRWRHVSPIAGMSYKDVDEIEEGVRTARREAA